MATNLEYIYRLKDLYSKRLEAITKKQLQFSEVFNKSLGKINSTALAHQRTIASTMSSHLRNSEVISQSAAKYSDLAHSITKVSAAANGLAFASAGVSNGFGNAGRASRRFGETSLRSSYNAMNGIRSLHSGLSSITDSVFNLRNAVAGSLAGFLAYKAVSFPVSKASEMEDLLIGYEVKLKGSKVHAQELLNSLEKMGASTPFNLPHLAKATDMILGIGDVTRENVIARIGMLGDLSQGDPEKLSRLSYAYAQVLSKGKLLGNDIYQITDAGVPLSAMSDALGMTTTQFYKAKESGKITAEVLTKAFVKMTSEGGLFYQMMIKKSKSFSGLMSTLQDNIGIVATRIGNTMLPYMKDIATQFITATDGIRLWVEVNKEFIGQRIGEYFKKISEAIKWAIDNYDVVINRVKFFGKVLIFTIGLMTVLKALILAHNAYLAIKAGILGTVSFATGAYNFVLALNGFLLNGNIMALRRSMAALVLVKTWTMIVTGATKLFSAGMVVLNAVMSANPIGIVIGLVAALAGVFGYAYSKLGSFTDTLKFMGGLIIKGLLTPINLVISSIWTLLKVASFIPGIGGSFGKAANAVDMMQGRLNEGLTGNRSSTAFGMMYDLYKAESGQGHTVSSWIENKTKAADREKRNYVESNVNVNGNITVSADKGSKVTGSTFTYMTGTNMAGAV